MTTEQGEFEMASRVGSRTGRRVGRAAAAVTLAGGLLLTGCASTSSSTAEPAGSSPPSASGATTAATLIVDITMTGDTVEPNGQKIDAAVGQQVVLRVTSDIDDEVHAHTGGNGFELEVPAGQPTTGTFTLDSPGSFEVESHHREKVLVIFNVR